MVPSSDDERDNTRDLPAINQLVKKVWRSSEGYVENRMKHMHCHCRQINRRLIWKCTCECLIKLHLLYQGKTEGRQVCFSSNDIIVEEFFFITMIISETGGN